MVASRGDISYEVWKFERRKTWKALPVKIPDYVTLKIVSLQFQENDTSLAYLTR